MKRLNQITLKQLRSLDAVARTGQFSMAADVVGLTGPAVHNQLKLLEEVIGAPLVSRSGSDRNKPTPQGEVLLAAYGELRASLERAIRQLDALDHGKAGAVVLGAVSTAKYFVPRIVAHLRHALPEIDVSLRIANRQETITALTRGEFDLCIMGRPPRRPLTEAHGLADHPHVLIAPPDHPLAGRRNPPLDALLSERFVLREPGSGTRIMAMRYLDELGHPGGANVVEMDSNETIKQAVMAGLGISLISGHTVAEELKSGRLVQLDFEGLPIQRKWFLLERPEKPLSAVAREVRDEIIAHRDQFFPELPPGIARAA